MAPTMASSRRLRSSRGVAGGALSQSAVLIVGAANLAADGLSMAVGNFLAIRSHESARAADNLPEEESHPVRHASRHSLPLLWPARCRSSLCVCRPSRARVLLVCRVDADGAVRGWRGPTRVTVDRWWAAGLEMLVLGLVVAAAAYGAGALIASVV